MTDLSSLPIFFFLLNYWLWIADVSAVVSHIDNILLRGNAKEKAGIKARFGAPAQMEDDDFAK